MIRIVSLFILTLSLHTIVASSAYATQAAKTQTASSVVVSRSAIAGKVGVPDSVATKSLPGEKQSVMDHPIIIGIVIWLLSVMIIALVKKLGPSHKCAVDQQCKR